MTRSIAIGFAVLLSIPHIFDAGEPRYSWSMRSCWTAPDRCQDLHDGPEKLWGLDHHD